MKDKQKLIEALRQPDGRYAIRDIVAVTEFRGIEGEDYPNVPISDGVDVKALTEGDDKPFFVTLKIAHAGIVSGNGVYYGDEEVNEILRQTVSKRPTGGQGHLRDDELSSALPANPGHWVGALRRNEFDWGKAYVAPGETRDWMRRLGATRSALATSIFGYAEELMWDEQHEAIRMVLHAPDENGKTGFDLEYIDFASPERAGVPSLATVPYITNEMRGEQPQNSEEHVDKLDVLKALTVEDVKLLPETVVAAVVAASETVKKAQSTVGELRTALGLGEDGDVMQAVKELADKVTKQEAAAIEAKITELVNGENGVKVPALRPIITELIKAEKPSSADAVQGAFELVVARESVKAMLTAEVARTMGSRQERPANAGQGGKKRQFFQIPAQN